MTEFFDAHPALAAVIAIVICFIVLWRVIIRRLEKQDRRSAMLLHRLDVKLSRTEGSLKSGVSTMAGAMNSAAGNLSAVSDSMEARQERMRREMEEKLSELRTSTETRLNLMSDKLGSEMQKALETRLGESFRLVSSQLESVYKGLGEMQVLAQSVGDLKRVLTGVKTRGVWGEVRLKALLEQDLPAGAWLENVCVKQGSLERVEFCVKMPGKSEDSEVLLPIDSKFPQEDYIRLTEASQAGNAAETEAARKALITRIKAEAKSINEKYIAPPYTTDFAIMFLPVEGLYAEVMQDPELAESIQRDRRVVIAGPGTFSAMLNALQMGFRTMAIEQRTTEVWHLLGEIRTDFGRFAEMLETTRKRIEQAGESIDSAVSKTRTIQRKLNDVEEATSEN